MAPKVLIIRTAGTNCDKETEFAFKMAGAKTSLHHINYIKKRDLISEHQIICIPGGFSYGDDLGAGKILSLEFICWLRDQIENFIGKGGLMLGICNGFQVLVKTGILPNLDFVQKTTLTFNDSGRFEDRWVYLRTGKETLKMKDKNAKPENIWLKDLPEIINLPVAHGEGKFYAERGILNKMKVDNQVALRYVDSRGDSAGYPFNPNGSMDDIAGITDSSGRILGLMPHPERFIFKHHSPFWKDKEEVPFGLKIFKNAVVYFK